MSMKRGPKRIVVLDPAAGVAGEWAGAAFVTATAAGDTPGSAATRW